MEIRFDYDCSFPFNEVEVLANENGTGIIVIDKITEDEIDFETISESDQNKILAQVEDWAIHYKIMKTEAHDYLR